MPAVEIALPITADDDAEQLQREQQPGDRLRRWALAATNGSPARTVSTIATSRLRMAMIERNGDQAEHGDSAQPHDQAASRRAKARA